MFNHFLLTIFLTFEGENSTSFRFIFSSSWEPVSTARWLCSQGHVMKWEGCSCKAESCSSQGRVTRDPVLPAGAYHRVSDDSSIFTAMSI